MRTIELNSVAFEIIFNRPLPQAVPTALDEPTREPARGARYSRRLDKTRRHYADDRIKLSGFRNYLQPPATAGGSDGFGQVDA